MNETEPDYSLLGIPIAHGNRRKAYYNLAPPPRSLPRRLKWNLLVGGFRHRHVWDVSLGLLALYGVTEMFWLLVTAGASPPSFAGWVLLAMMAGIVAFAVLVIRQGQRRIRLFEIGALALGQLEKEQPTDYHCTWFNRLTAMEGEPIGMPDDRLLKVKWTKYLFTFAFQTEDGRACSATAITNDRIWRFLKAAVNQRIIYDPQDPTEAVVVNEFAPWIEIDATGRLLVQPGFAWCRELLLPFSCVVAVSIDLLLTLLAA